MQTYYSNRVRGKIHSNENVKMVSNRIVSVETEEKYNASKKIVSIFVGLVFFSSPIWGIALLDFLVKYGTTIKTIIGA